MRQSSTDPRLPPRGYRWCVVAMLWLVCLFNYADRQAISSVFEPIKREMKLHDWQLGIIGSSFMWVYAAALPFAGAIADRVNRKALILGGLLFWSFITLATGWCREYEQLVALRALEGLGEAFYFPASMSLLADYHGHTTRSRALALHQSSVYAGTILGGVVAGYCGQHYGWRSGFYLFGALGMGLAVVLLFFLREPTRGAADTAHVPEPPACAQNAFRDAAEVLRNRMVLVLIAVFVGANFVATIFLSWLPTYLTRTFHMDLTLAGLNATAWPQLASIVGVLLGGWLADRWARKDVGGRMRVQVLGLFLGAPFIFMTGWTTEVPVLMWALAGFGFCKGVYDANIWASLYDVVPSARRATAQGLMNGIGWLGGGTGPAVIGAAAGYFGMGTCLSATSLIYLLVGAVMFVGIVVVLPRVPITSAAPTAQELVP
jgi:MFS family permease